MLLETRKMKLLWLHTRSAESSIQSSQDCLWWPIAATKTSMYFYRKQ